MVVPEAPMNKDHFVATGKYQIWLAGQLPAVKTVSVAHTVQEPPHIQLRLCILRPDAAHSFTTLGRT